MAKQSKTREEEIFDQYLQDGNFTEEQKNAVLDALIESEKRHVDANYQAPEGKSVEEDVLDEYLKNHELSDEQQSMVLDAMVEMEKHRIKREADEISDNINNLSAEELESLANNWARTPGADELRAKIAARQEELRANAAPEAADENEVVNNSEESKETSESASVQEAAQAETLKEDEQPVSSTSSEPKADVSAGETPADDISSEKSEINQYNAVEKAKNLKGLLPSQLATLRNALNARPNDETKAASIKVEDHIVSEAGKYADGKLSLTNIDEVYALNDLLVLVKTYPNSEKTKENIATVEKAITAAQSEIQNFEEQYGIDNTLLQEPQVVESNIAKLDGMPQDKDIFELNILEEKLQPALDNTADLQGILNTAEKNNSVPEISVLTGMLQKLDKDKAHPSSGWEDLQKKVLELTEKRVKDTKSLEQKDFKNFEYLLAALKESPNADKLTSTLKKKEKLLSDSRQDYLKSASLKDKEFQDIYNILSNIKVNGKLKAFGREQIGQEGTDSDIALFLEQTRRETEMYLANTGKDITADTFKQEYALRLRKNLVEVLAADQFSKGKNSKEDYAAMFDKLATAAQSKKGININQDTFVGWQAARTNRMEAAVNRLGQKSGYENAAKSFGERVKATDQKLTQKYGKAYSLLKGCLKSAGWGAAYVVAGSTLGPAGIAAVATVSFANQTYGFFKNFKKERDEAKAKGEKPTNFWQYISKNKLRTAGLLLSGASAAIGIGGVGENIAVQIARSYTGIGLATAGAAHQAAQAYKQTEGSKGKKAWKAAQAALFSGASFYAGMLAGREASEIAGAAFTDTPIDTNINTTETELSDIQAHGIANEMHDPSQSEYTIQAHGIANEMYGPSQSEYTGPYDLNEMPQAGNDIDQTIIPDQQVGIDLNNLSAEQQHDIKMLFLRDPAEANQILGQEGDQWMNSAELQEAWDNGTLTDAQKAQLVEFGGQRFDEHGNFQDVEGYKTGTQMEAEAKEWTAAQEAKTLENQAAGTPETRRSDFEPIPTIGDDVNNALQGKAETLEQSGLAGAEAQQQSEVKINKIKINDEGEVKIVGQDENGRFVERTDMSSLQNMPEDLDYNKIKFHDNGDISVRLDTETGHEVKVTIDKDGHYQSITSGSHVYSKEELDYVNNNLDNHPEALEHNQDRYNALQSMRDGTEQNVSETRAQTEEAPAPEQKAEQEATATEQAPEQEVPTRETVLTSDGGELAAAVVTAEAPTQETVLTSDGGELAAAVVTAEAPTQETVLTSDGGELAAAVVTADAPTQETVLTSDGGELAAAVVTAEAPTQETVLTSDGGELAAAVVTAEAPTQETVLTSDGGELAAAVVTAEAPTQETVLTSDGGELAAAVVTAGRRYS